MGSKVSGRRAVLEKPGRFNAYTDSLAQRTGGVKFEISMQGITKAKLGQHGVQEQQLTHSMRTASPSPASQAEFFSEFENTKIF